MVLSPCALGPEWYVTIVADKTGILHRAAAIAQGAAAVIEVENHLSSI